MSRRHLSLSPAVVAAALTFGGCAARQSSSLDRLNAQPPEEYRGHYTPGPGGAWFRPCGMAAADSAWWVTVTDAAIPQIDSARRAGQLLEDRPSFVHWRAVRTQGGEVGPRGATALLVREVLTVRPAAASDCAAR
jgi:hypothetical protein